MAGYLVRRCLYAVLILVGTVRLHAGTRACPDVSIRIAANAVGSGRGACPRHVELDETLPITQNLSIDVPDFDIAWRARVRNVELLVVR